MKFLLKFLFILIAIKSFSQEVKSYSLTKGSDTIYWQKYKSPIIKKLNLILPNQNVDFFRLSSSKYYLELSKNTNKVVFYGDEIYDSKKTGKTFIKSFNLKNEEVVKIKKLVDSLKIENIPSDRYIQNWQQGFDGITYNIEFKKDDIYSFKNYWTPNSQENLNEAIIINSFVTAIDDIIDLKSKGNVFREEIPFYSWTRDGEAWIAIKAIKNHDEYKKYIRLKKKQLN
jgi:hypothetical protein